MASARRSEPCPGSAVAWAGSGPCPACPASPSPLPGREGGRGALFFQPRLEVAGQQAARHCSSVLGGKNGLLCAAGRWGRGLSPGRWAAEGAPGLPPRAASVPGGPGAHRQVRSAGLRRGQCGHWRSNPRGLSPRPHHPPRSSRSPRAGSRRRARVRLYLLDLPVGEGLGQGAWRRKKQR